MFSIKSSFLKNILVLFRGNVLFQITIILTLIFLARNYAPEQIGKYAVFISIISIISTVSTGRFEMALMLPKKEEKAYQVFIVSTLFVLTIALFFTTLSLIMFYFGFFFSGNDIYIIPLLFFGILSAGLTLVQIQYLNRFEKFSVTSNGKTITALTIAFLQVLSVYFFKSVFFLVLSYTIGFFISVLYYHLNLKDHIKPYSASKFEVKSAFKTYKNFPLINNFSSLFNMVANQGPIIFIEAVFGSATSGFYAVVQKTLNAPVSLVGAAFSQVFYKKITTEDSNSNIRNLMKSSTKYFAILSILILIVVFIFSDQLYVLVFGQAYIISAVMAKIMVFFFIARLIFVSQNAVLIAQNKLKLDLGFNVLYMIAILSPILIAKIFDLSWATCLTIMSVSGTFVFLFLGFILFKKVK